MKKSLILILPLWISVAGFAQEFTTGQGARLVVGQPTWTAQQIGVSDRLLGGVSGLAYANNMLFVADSNNLGSTPVNNRVLLYKNLNSQIPDPHALLPQGNRCPVCVGRASLVLGQPDFSTTNVNLTQAGMRAPLAVATDGNMVAVSDTDNNRVLIWKSLPTQNGQPADLVLGQKDFTSNAISDSGDPRVPTASSLRGPQGVWIQNGKLFVADAQNQRVLIWNSIPTQNGQPADLVLGQPDFHTLKQPDFGQGIEPASSTNMLYPVSVTSDGTHLFVTCLLQSRVLIWNSIPTKNQQPADVVVGQPDLNSSLANNSSKLSNPSDATSARQKVLCDSNGTDSNNNPTYPPLCAATLNYPRYALSDGTRLFIADGGNDRVLVFNQIPTQNGANANAVLGQISDTLNQASSSAYPQRIGAPDALRTPLSLAWDGTNLYVSNPFDRRVTVFSEGEIYLPYTTIRNAASREIYAGGAISIAGTIDTGTTVDVQIAGTRDYKYKTVSGDTAATIVSALVGLINAGNGDADLIASPNTAAGIVILTARKQGPDGNSVKYSATLDPTTSTITVTAASSTLAGGQDAAQVAPGTLVSIQGDNLADNTLSADLTADELPNELGGVRVYFDGISSPLLYVSPHQINTQVSFAFSDVASCSAYVRVERKDGTVQVSQARAVTILGQTPGIFAMEGPNPRQAVALHSSSNASGTILLSGTVKTGDQAIVTIEDRKYTYTAVANDGLDQVRDGLIKLINADPKVSAVSGGQFDWVILKAKVVGSVGNGIKYSATTSSGASVVLSTSSDALCCASDAGTLVTDDKPAAPGETVIIYATGLGVVKPQAAQDAAKAGVKYTGPSQNSPAEFVSSLAGGKTANVLYAGLKPGTFGLYEVQLELNSGLGTNPKTQMTIAQSFFVSNIVTIPVKKP